MQATSVGNASARATHNPSASLAARRCNATRVRRDLRSPASATADRRCDAWERGARSAELPGRRRRVSRARMLITRPYGLSIIGGAQRLVAAAAVIGEHLSLVVHRRHRRRAEDRLEQAIRDRIAIARSRSRWRPAPAPTGNSRIGITIQWHDAEMPADRRRFALEWRTETEQPIERGLRNHQAVLVAFDQLAQPGLDVAAHRHGLDRAHRATAAAAAAPRRAARRGAATTRACAATPGRASIAAA